MIILYLTVTGNFMQVCQLVSGKGSHNHNCNQRCMLPQTSQAWGQWVHSRPNPSLSSSASQTTQGATVSVSMNRSIAHLAGGGEVSGDVLHSDWVLHIQPVALALHPGLVHQHTSIGCESCKCQGYMFVHTADLPDCPGVLQLGQSSLLHGQHYSIFAPNCYLEHVSM